MRWLALALAALALTGCESNQERSAKLEKVAKARERATGKQGALARNAAVVTHESTKVKVVATKLLKSSEGTAAVITLRNDSPTALRDVPIEINIDGPTGSIVYTNATPGLAAGLNSASWLPADAETDWIDDQIQASGTAAKIDAKVGEGTVLSGPLPKLAVVGAHIFDDATSGEGAEGNVTNASTIDQPELVVNAIVRRGGEIIAAGRAVLSSAPAGQSTRFQAFLIGASPTDGQLQVTAPPTAFE